MFILCTLVVRTDWLADYAVHTCLFIQIYNHIYVLPSPHRSNKKAYLLDWLNYVQWFFIVLILAVVPLRATAHPGQWIVAALAYLVFGLQAFEFLIISSWAYRILSMSTSLSISIYLYHLYIRYSSATAIRKCSPIMCNDRWFLYIYIRPLAIH